MENHLFGCLVPEGESFGVLRSCRRIACLDILARLDPERIVCLDLLVWLDPKGGSLAQAMT